MAPYLVDIVDWGSVCLGTTGSQFNNINLSTWTATGQPCIQDPTSFLDIFYNASRFNQPLAGWDTRNSAFNQPLGDWNVGMCTDFAWMFQNMPFNQPLDNWNMSKAADISKMFDTNTAFNQSLGAWDVSAVTNCLSFAGGGALALSNYPAWDCAFVDFSEDPAVKDGSCTACSAGSQSVAADCLAFTCSPGYISRSPSPFCILPSPSPSPSFSPSKSPVSATPSTSLSPSPISTSPSVSLSPSVSDSLSSSQSISISSSLSLTPTISTTPSSSPSASSSKTSSASTSTSRSPTLSASPSHLPSLSPSKSPAAVVAMPVLCGDGACQTAATENCSTCALDCGWCPPPSPDAEAAAPPVNCSAVTALSQQNAVAANSTVQQPVTLQGAGGIQVTLPANLANSLGVATVVTAQYSPEAQTCLGAFTRQEAPRPPPTTSATKYTNTFAPDPLPPAPPVFLGPVVTITIYNARGEKIDIKNLSEPIEFFLPMETLPPQDACLPSGVAQQSIPECSYYRDDLAVWSTDGCTVGDPIFSPPTDKNPAGQLKIMCRCNHLTEFAVLLRTSSVDPFSSPTCALSPSFLLFAGLYAAYGLACLAQVI
eukprot:g70483.t1